MVFRTPAGPNGYRLSIWAAFLLFLFLDSILAWTPFSVWERLFWFPLALVLQTYLSWKTGENAPLSDKDLRLKEWFDWPRWAWIPFTGAFLFIGLFHLRSLNVWPSWDDANYSYFAIDLSEKWSWRLFFGPEGSFPFYTWLQSVLFKWTEPSLGSMWLYAASLQLLCVPLSYFASRAFFSKSLSVVLAFLFAFSFWPLFYGRFCNGGIGLVSVVWELSFLWAWGLFLRSRGRKSAWSYALLLGLCGGIGAYISILCLIPLALCTIAFLALVLRGPSQDRKIILYYGGPMLLLGMPMVGGTLQNILAGHVYTYSIFSSQGLSLLHWTVNCFSYLTVFFFGSIDKSYWAFGPLSGGFLNPVLSALFFIGLGEIWRSRRIRTIQGMAVWVLFSWLPLLFLNSLEFAREILLMPFFLMVCALGVLRLFSTLERKKWAFFLSLLFLISLSLDLDHLWGSYHQWSATGAMTPGLAIKSTERFKAFQLLEQENQKEGPGLVFSEFVSDIYDQSLLVSTYPFNAGRNPRLTTEKVNWAAILTEIHYRDAILKRFPGAEFHLLSEPPFKDDPILGLVIIPTDPRTNHPDFSDWIGLHRSLQDLYGIMPYHVQQPDFHPVLLRLFALYPQAQKDPLLKAWVLEKALDPLLVSNNLTDALWFMDQPVQDTRSYPFLDGKFALMYHKLGMGLLKAGEIDKARESFKRASLFDPKYELKKWLALCDSTRKGTVQ